MPEIDRPSLDRRLAAHDQQHLLGFWDQLDPGQRQSLARQIESLDLALIGRLVSGEDRQEDVRQLVARAESPPAVRLGGANRFAPAEARQRGQLALGAGKVGAILVAGGQGTRLGFDHPKGMFPIGPVSRRSLFQILFEKIVASARRYGVRIPLYLMTSPATHDETLRYLEENERFGLAAEDVRVFCQGTMPAVDAQTGHILLEAPDRVFSSPDGHGGMLAALARSGGLDDIERRGIEQLFYFQVDNPLVAVCGAEFLGYHLLAGSELTTQVVAKQDPLERVGNVVAIDGRLRIIEYSDLPDDAARQTCPDGGLRLWAGSIGVHAMSAAFLQRMSGMADALPFHRAKKKVPHIDAQGRTVEPASPNAIKFERFVFDLLPHAEGAIVVEVDPAEAFAPLKNGSVEASDTPETVRRQMSALHRRWLAAAGAEVRGEEAVEIGPLWALDAEEVAQKVKPAEAFETPLFLGDSA